MESQITPCAFNLAVFVACRYCVGFVSVSESLRLTASNLSAHSTKCELLKLFPESLQVNLKVFNLKSS
jgi:hypothetical protein